MILCKKHLVVFGGYHDNGLDYKYYNDVHLFDLESRTWRKIEPSGTIAQTFNSDFNKTNRWNFFFYKALLHHRDRVVKWCLCLMVVY